MGSGMHTSGLTSNIAAAGLKESPACQDSSQGVGTHCFCPPAAATCLCGGGTAHPQLLHFCLESQPHLRARRVMGGQETWGAAAAATCARQVLHVVLPMPPPQVLCREVAAGVVPSSGSPCSPPWCPGCSTAPGCRSGRPAAAPAPAWNWQTWPQGRCAPAHLHNSRPINLARLWHGFGEPPGLRHPRQAPTCLSLMPGHPSSGRPLASTYGQQRGRRRGACGQMCCSSGSKAKRAGAGLPAVLAAGRPLPTTPSA